MGDPGLPQEVPDIPPLLPDASGDREQAAPADCPLAGLDSLTELALNQRHALGSFCGCLVGLIRPFSRKIHHPLQRGLKCLANWQAALLQGEPVNRSFLVVVPVAKNCCCWPSSFAPNSALAPRRSAMAVKSRTR